MKFQQSLIRVQKQAAVCKGRAAQFRNSARNAMGDPGSSLDVKVTRASPPTPTHPHDWKLTETHFGTHVPVF